MSRALRVLAVVLAAQAVSLATAMPAQARKQNDLRWRYEQVWSAAVRMVRVDLRFAVDVQDQETGFVLFQFRERAHAVPGSIELIRTEVEGVPYVRVVVQIPSMPMYVEQMMMDRLQRKLMAEFGAPPAAPRRPAAPPEGEEPREPGDDGDDDDRDGEPPRDEQAADDEERRPEPPRPVVMRGNTRVRDGQSSRR